MIGKPLKSPQREKFAQEIALGKSQSEAYRIAYPVSKTWKNETVWTRASELAADRKVVGRVRELTAPALARLAISIERILTENARIAFSDIRTLFDDNGNLKPVKDWSDAMTGAVSIIEISEVRIDENITTCVKKIKLWDKSAALEKMFKYAGPYGLDNDQTEKLMGVTEMLEEIARIGRGLPMRAMPETMDVEIQPAA